MFYVAIFSDGQISLPYSSTEQLEAHNSFRMNKLHGIVRSISKDGLNDEIKASLRLLRKV